VTPDPVGAEIIGEVARRILSDETGKITVGTEAVRLNREGIPCPSDRRAQLYGRPVTGGTWPGSTLKHILRSEAALGYLLHEGRPVTGAYGRPARFNVSYASRLEPILSTARPNKTSRRTSRARSPFWDKV